MTARPGASIVQLVYSRAAYGMPLELPANNACLLIRRPAFERAGITRSAIDERLGLTDQEFRVEGDLIVVGPIHDHDAMQRMTDDLETAGLVYFEDFFDLSGNWPEWLVLFAKDSGRQRINGA